MTTDELAARATLIGRVAYEASEESDAIERNPGIIDALRELAVERQRMHVAFGSNGHDPEAFLNALADGLEIYRVESLDNAPELIEGLGLVAQALQSYIAGSAASA